MNNTVVPTPRDLLEQSKGMQPILNVGQTLRGGQITVKRVLTATSFEVYHRDF